MSAAWVFILPEFIGQYIKALTEHPSRDSAGNLKKIKNKSAKLIPNVQNLFLSIITKFYKKTGRLVIIKLGKKLSAFITKFDRSSDRLMNSKRRAVILL
jgi:hypothetical protein